MKKFKAVLAIVLVAVMVCGLLAACNGNGTKTDDTGKASGPLTKVVLAYLDVSGNDQAEWDRQEAYINSISEPAIGVTVDLMVGQMGDYGTTVPMMIAGNEQLDLVNVCPVGAARYSTLLGNGSLKDISAELKEFAPQTLEIVGGMIKNYQVGDAIYGVPSNRISTSNEYMIFARTSWKSLAWWRRRRTAPAGLSWKRSMPLLMTTARITTCTSPAVRRSLPTRTPSGPATHSPPAISWTSVRTPPA